MTINYIGHGKRLLQVDGVVLDINCIKEIIIDTHDNINHLVFMHLENVPSLRRFDGESADDLINFLKINAGDLNIPIEYINCARVDI